MPFFLNEKIWLNCWFVTKTNLFVINPTKVKRSFVRRKRPMRWPLSISYTHSCNFQSSLILDPFYVESLLVIRGGQGWSFWYVPILFILLISSSGEIPICSPATTPAHPIFHPCPESCPWTLRWYRLSLSLSACLFVCRVILYVTKCHPSLSSSCFSIKNGCNYEGGTKKLNDMYLRYMLG